MITENFSLQEFISSETGKKKRIDNTPGPKEIENIERLVKEILQPVRNKYGKPIKVTSGYRCPALNTAVGGSKKSQHLSGEAADIKAGDGDNAKLFKVFQDMMKAGEITFGQLIWEYGTSKQPSWIHVSLGNKNQILYLGVKK